MVTDNGDMHCKFSFTNGGEGPYTPANEAIAHSILELLGMQRPPRWLVEVPDWMSAATPELSSLRSNLGLGTDWVDNWGVELQVAQIQAEAPNAPGAELLAQQLALTWLQVNDHSHNFVKDGPRLIAVDFATGPSAAVWEGQAPLGTGVTDHAGLASVLAGLPPDTRAEVRDRFDAITRGDLIGILDEIPDGWADPEQRLRIVEALWANRGAVRAVVA